MRGIGFFFTAAVTAFWLAMNGLLVWREVEYRGLDQYRRGVLDFLGDQVRRDRWMGIYRNQKRIGFTGFSIERRLETLGYRIEFATQLGIDLFGQGGRFEIEGESNLDSEMVPDQLHAQVSLGGVRFRLEGRREQEGFMVRLHDGEKVVFQRPFPLRDLHFGDGLAPVPPVAKLQVGETYRIKVFDPIFRESSEAETRVLSQATRDIDGIAMDCLELETRYRGMTFRSFITRDGELIRQVLPPPLDVTLLREPVRPREKRQ